MATKLELYQAALVEMGEERLSSISEATERRYVLDGVYNKVLALCLESGSWNFALDDVQIDSDPDIEPAFGYQFAFTKPTNWVRTAAISADENFVFPLTDYVDRTYWFANTDPIYVSFVSDHTDFGLNLGIWPESFTRFVELALAERASKRGGMSADRRQEIKADLKEARQSALAKDALNEAQGKRLPTGRFVGERLGSRGSYGGSWRSGVYWR